VDQNTQSRIKAYLTNIQQKFKIETNAKLIKSDLIQGIQYAQQMQQPWPRKFDYRLEFFALDDSPSAVDKSIKSYLEDSPEEYVLTLLTDNINTLIPTYKALGYQHAWSNTIMENKLSVHAITLKLDPDIEILPVETSKDVAAINAMGSDFPTSIKGLKEENIHNFYATYKKEIAAKAQGITFDSNFIYLSDMFTHPQYRRKGLSFALLQKLHQIGRSKGCSYSILVPSQMTRDIELYQRFSYNEVVTMALMVPMFSPIIKSGFENQNTEAG